MSVELNYKYREAVVIVLFTVQVTAFKSDHYYSKSNDSESRAFLSLFYYMENNRMDGRKETPWEFETKLTMGCFVQIISVKMCITLHIRLHIRFFCLNWLSGCYLFSVHVLENAGVYLAICVHILPEILAKVAHQTGNREMWAAENMLQIQARGNKDNKSRWIKSSKICSIFFCFLHIFKIIATVLLCPIVEYSLQSSKNKVRKCYHC